MRRYPLILLSVFLVLAIGTTACDSASSAENPQELLTTAWNAAQHATSQSGTYELTVTVAADASKTPAGSQGIAQALLGRPITLAGDFATSDNPHGADISLTTSLMGMNPEVGGILADSKAYFNVLGQWYEVPQEMQQKLVQDQQTAGIAEDLRQALAEMDLDPMSWCVDLKVAGEETLVGTEVVHLTSKLDVHKMLADMTALMQTEKIAALLASSSTSTTQYAFGGLGLPSAAQIKGQMAGIEKMFQNATLDLWLAKSDSTMRKLTLTTDVVVPAQTTGSGTTAISGITRLAGGITGANVVATLNLSQPGQTVKIMAPASAKPMADLRKDLQNNPIFGLFRGAMSANTSGTTTTSGF